MRKLADSDQLQGLVLQDVTYMTVDPWPVRCPGIVDWVVEFADHSVIQRLSVICGGEDSESVLGI